MQDELHTCGANAHLVQVLVDHKVDFLVVGGLAVVFHCCRDETDVGDLDLMLNPVKDNTQRFIDSLPELGLRIGWAAADLSRPNVQVPIKNTYYVDVLTPPDDIDYEALKKRSLPARINRISVRVVSREDLIALKRIAVMRQKNERAKHKKDLKCLVARSQTL